MIYTDIIAFIRATFPNALLKNISLVSKCKHTHKVYPLRFVVWIVDNLLNGEDLIWLLRLADDLDPGVELSAHYHQVLRLSQGVNWTASAKWTFIFTTLPKHY